MAVPNILLVDDNSADAKLFAELIKQSEMKCSLHVAVDGLDAMDFLLQRGKRLGAPRPDLVLLDLNLPRKDGRQVLKEVKEHGRLRQIPVLILTSSTAEEDVFASYDGHANGYLVKPMSLDDLSLLLRRIEEFWLSEVRLPKERQASPTRKLRDEEFGKRRNDEYTGTP